MTLIEHPDAATLAQACGRLLAEAIAGAREARGAALLSLAGGRTAPPILRALVAQHPGGSGVTVLPTDERWVPSGHPDHNLEQLKSALSDLDGVTFRSLTPVDLTTWPAAPQTDAAVELLLGLRSEVFDAVLLGMGADGHFASLFPGAGNLQQGLDPRCTADVLAIIPDPMPAGGPWPRLSLTLARLLRSRLLLLAITGQDKRVVLERALAGDTSLPVQALLRQSQSPGNLSKPSRAGQVRGAPRAGTAVHVGGQEDSEHGATKQSARAAGFERFPQVMVHWSP